MRNFVVIILLLVLGFIFGFTFTEGIGNLLLAAGLVLLFAYAFSWISATIGLVLKDTETVQVSGLVWLFPLMFASSVFVPVTTMPDWLQGFASNQPVTQVVDAVRHLTHGTGSGDAVWWTLMWVVIIMLIFVPLAVWRYRKIQ